MLADDTKLKLYMSIGNINDHTSIQHDLDTLASWSNDWLLKFNENKCTVLKLRKNDDLHYTLNNTPLTEVSEQRDLGVMISNTLHPRTHVAHIA